MIVVISVTILPFLIFSDTISLSEAKVYILQPKTNNLNGASEKDDAHTNVRTDVLLKLFELVLNKDKDVKSTEHKCMRLFSSIYGTKEDKLKCLKNIKQKRLEEANIALKVHRPYVNKFTDLTRISEDYFDMTDLLRNSKVFSDYSSHLRSQKPLSGKQPKDSGNSKKNPNFSSDYIDFDDLRTRMQRPNKHKDDGKLQRNSKFSSDYIDFSDLRTRRPRTIKPHKDIMSNPKLQPIFSNDYIDFGNLRTRKQILSESSRKSTHHSSSHHKHESKARTAYPTSSDDESMRFNAFADNLKQKKATIDPKRFQIIGNDMNQLGMTSKFNENSDFQSSSEEVSKPIFHKIKKEKTRIKKNKYPNSYPSPGEYYKPVKYQKIKKVELASTESIDSSLSEEFTKPVKIKNNNRKPVYSVKYNNYYDSFSSDDSKPIRNKQKKYIKPIQTDDSESFEREYSKPRKIKQIKKVAFNENKYTEWDRSSEEYARPIKTKNIKEKETYLQGNHVITIRTNKDGRRLEGFLPKRFHWRPDEIKDLGYYWFNGPQGKYSHIRIRP